MPDTPDMGRGAIARWLALFDQAARLQAGGYDRPDTSRAVARAIDSLFAYEHQITPDARRIARETLWRRERSSSLPPDRSWWAECRCRACALDRARLAADRRPSVWQEQSAVLARQRRIAKGA